MSIELVTWRDAYFVRERGDEDHADYLVETVGWVEEQARFLVVVGERLPNDDGDRAVTFIPNENVVNREKLDLLGLTVTPLITHGGTA